MDDILFTNKFETDRPTNTYGVQTTLKEQVLKEHLGKEVQFLDEPDDSEELLEDDLLVTNSLKPDPDILKERKLDKSRYIREIRSYLNVDSRDRKLFREELVPKDPNTKQYTREVCCRKTGEIKIKKFTADDLNLEFQDSCVENPILDPFIERNGNIYYCAPCDSNPNCYQLELPKPLSNVKLVRIISSEIPNPFTTINNFNNIILVDVINAETCQSIPLSTCNEKTHNHRSKEKHNLPFILYQIPIGTYDLPTLLETIQDGLNELIACRTNEAYQNLFRITGDTNTGKVEICLCPTEGKKLKFHWRFWCCPSIPQNRLLYYMLGFPRPFERECDGGCKYVTCLDNLYKFPGEKLENINSNCQTNPSSNKVMQGCNAGQPSCYGFKEIKPYRQINLQPENYIYLVIEEVPSTFLDLDQPSSQIFSKIVLPVPPCTVAYNTFVNTPMFFYESPTNVEKLTIKWVDTYGNLIDFGGKEHSFTLEFTQYLDRLAVNDYSSKRGVIDPTSFTSKERVFSYQQ